MTRIDLRSDTLTQPSEQMLMAMISAKTGDMVFDEDPTVNELEKRSAEMFGMEAGLFCPSGTMSNQVGIKVHTRPGDEVICSSLAHIYLNEGGGIGFNSGASVSLIDTCDGTFTSDQVLNRINPDDPHKAQTRLVSVENTVNRGGGKVWNFEEIVGISNVCRKNNLKFHLDGARIFNALAETSQLPPDYGKIFDSISFCFSKGLGAPVGSVLLGSKDFIKQAKRIRKVFGGTMRQAGYIAAACIYALENNIERLKVDHGHAKMLEKALGSCSYVEKVLPVESNIVIFRLTGQFNSADILNRLKERNIYALAIDNRSLRFVTHLDVNPEMIGEVCDVLKKLV